jgi:hypothetical protein
MRHWLVSAMAVLVSCGYTGDPLPPALNIPQPVAAIDARQVGDKIKISFTIPAVTTDNIALRRLGGVELRLNDEAIAVTATEPGPVQLDVPAAAWANQRIVMSVRVASPRGKWSTPAVRELDVVAPLGPPQNVKAEPHPQGVKLTWQASGAETRILRNQAEIAKVETNEWVDATAKFGETYEYTLQAVRQTAESDPASPVRITPEDKFPPSVPANLNAVQGINAVELTWDRSPEPDTAGYRVYRAQAGEEMRPIGELTVAASFSDRTAKRGATYRYAVAAVDQKANESPLSNPVEVVAP